MSWDVQTRQIHEHGSHVKVSWRELGTIDDVSIDCPHGVHGVGDSGLVRQQMNSFSKAIDAYVQWDEGVEHPFVILAWTDAGEECEELLRLDVPHGQRPSSYVGPRSAAYLRDGFRRVLGKRPHVPAKLHVRGRQRADA